MPTGNSQAQADSNEYLSRGCPDARSDTVDFDELISFLLSQVARRFGQILNSADVDDVVEETMLRLLNYEKTYSQFPANYSAWSSVTASRLAIDHIRRNSRERRRLQALARQSNKSEREPGRESVPDFATLKRALSSLPIDDRAILLASVGPDQKRWAANLAAEEHLDAGAIRQKRFRAMSKLRAELARLEYPSQ